jgi:YD repeat-containing protein
VGLEYILRRRTAGQKPAVNCVSCWPRDNGPLTCPLMSATHNPGPSACPLLRLAHRPRAASGRGTLRSAESGKLGQAARSAFMRMGIQLYVRTVSHTTDKPTRCGEALRGQGNAGMKSLLGSSKSWHRMRSRPVADSFNFPVSHWLLRLNGSENLDRKIASADSLNYRASTTGQAAAQTNARGFWTTNTYDLAGQTIGVINQQGYIWSSTFDGDGRQVASTNPLNYIWTTVSDAAAKPSPTPTLSTTRTPPSSTGAAM